MGFEDLGLGLEVLKLGYEVLKLGYEVLGLGYEVLGSELRSPVQLGLSSRFWIPEVRSLTTKFQSDPKVTLWRDPLLRYEVFAGLGWEEGWASEFESQTLGLGTWVREEGPPGGG